MSRRGELQVLEGHRGRHPVPQLLPNLGRDTLLSEYLDGGYAHAMSAKIGGLGLREVAALDQRAPDKEAERTRGHVVTWGIGRDKDRTLGVSGFAPGGEEKEGARARVAEPDQVVVEEREGD